MALRVNSVVLAEPGDGDGEAEGVGGASPCCKRWVSTARQSSTLLSSRAADGEDEDEGDGVRGVAVLPAFLSSLTPGTARARVRLRAMALGVNCCDGANVP